jgi:hypothetical protein
MKRLIIIVMSLTYGVLAQQQPQPIHVGQHTLLEATDDFLKIETKFRDDLAVCQEHPKKNKDWCLRLKRIFVEHSPYVTSIGKGLGSTDEIWWTWSFAGGRLLKMELMNIPFVETVRDLSQRLGKPEEAKEQRQNGFGATWELVADRWVTKDVYAMAVLNPAPVNPSVSLVLETRDLYDLESRANVKPSDRSPIN